MPHGWIVEAITREAGSTLVMHEWYDVAIADERAARAAVEKYLSRVFSVRVEMRDPIPEATLLARGLAPGDVRRH
jgi:hypothetical protein